MQTVLRDTWGLRGFVVSDCGAVGGGPAGAITSLQAGTDLECNPWGQSLYPSLVNSTKAGNVSASYIAKAAERLLYVRFRLGAFDPPSMVPFANTSHYGAGADMTLYEQVSLEAAQQSMVLLKNDGILPLQTYNSPYKTIAAVGIMNCMGSGYDTAGATAKKVFTDAALAKAFPAAAIRSGPGCRCPFGPGTNDEGCETCPGCSWEPSSGLALCTNYNESNVTAAVHGADLIVLHLGFGGRPGEQTDLKNLSLYPNQTKMLNTVLATKKPVILVLFTNLPADITALVPDPRVNAIVQAYYPQHWGGKAIVDVLTGAYNPGGRLIATWPKVYDPALHGDIGNYTMLGTKKTYRFSFPDPLFPFGYGLSYTSWQYSGLALSASPAPSTATGALFDHLQSSRGGVPDIQEVHVKSCQNLTATVTVHNTGAVDGTEVVQLYASWSGVDSPTADITLVNFDRVHVPAGSSVTVSLVVDARHYAVLQEQPPGPKTVKEPNGSWVPPAWVMKQAKVTLYVGGQQPHSTPRLASNVLSAAFVVDGDGGFSSKCPKYIPHDHTAPTKYH